MNTARDLALLALGASPEAPVEQGNVSLVLAGSELLDLAEAGALQVDGDRIVPGAPQVTGDHLLDEAAATLVREEPYESVEEWLWRRGQGLSSAYDSAMEKEGLTTRERGRRIPLRSGRTVLVESPERERAETRLASGDPVVTALVAAAGIRDEPAEAIEVTDDTVTTVLAAVGDAVMELEAVRQRRAIENAAFDNIWRGGV